MATLGELLGREAGRMNYLTAPLIDGPSVQPDTDNALTGGQARRAWINALTDGNLDYYLGPTGIPDRLRVVNMMNPVADMFEAMQNSRAMMDGSRSGRERFDAGVDMVTNMAAVLAPVVAGKVAGGADEAADVVDALLGFGGPTREAATDYAKRFAADEAGNIRLPIGDAVETRGSDILDLLRNGRAGEVTDEMLDLGDPTLNARLNEYLFRNYDMPMDEASRMARAREMGFDTDTPLYHGTTAPDFSEFKPSNRGRIGPGVYLTPNERLSNVFAGAAPMDVKMGEPAIPRSRVLPVVSTNKPAPNLSPERNAADAARREAGLASDEGRLAFQRELGEYDGVFVDDQRTILDPRNIRSRFARFDPRLSHLRNLSAGAAGLGILGGANMQNDDNQPLRAYLGL